MIIPVRSSRAVRWLAACVLSLGVSALAAEPALARTTGVAPAGLSIPPGSATVFASRADRHLPP